MFAQYMTTVFTWCGAHPELTSALVGALVTTFLGSYTQEQYDAMPPKLAATIRLLKGIFPDTPKVVSAIKQFLTGRS